MANIDQNPIWDQVSSGSASATTAVMGPEYSYADNIKGPGAMGVGSQGTIRQIGTNSGAITEYVKYMISGPALGNQYFVNTGGSCKATDQSIQPRYNYINNVSNGASVLPESMRKDLGGVASDFNGLLPGMLQDVEGLNPVNLFSALAADSTPSCECYTCPVTGGEESRFMNMSLTPDFSTSTCKPADISKCIKSNEGFTDGSSTPILLGIGLLVILMACQ
jgi:hypothetical protein